MKRILNYLSAAIMGLTLVSCYNDFDTERGVWSGSEGDIAINFEVDGEMPLTRGIVADEHEIVLKSVHLLFFDKNNDEEFAGFCTVHVANGKKQFSFDAPESLSPETPYSVLAVGNSDLYLEDKDINTATLLQKYLKDGASYNDILGDLAAYSDEAVTSYNLEALPLFGHYLDENNEDADFVFKLDGNKQTVEKGTHFFFSRATCRIDLHNLVGQQLKIISARVVNNRNAGIYFMDGLNAGIQKELEPQEAPAGNGYMPVTKDMVEGESTTQRIQASLYTFPNTVATSVVNDKKTTALMIAGYWYDSEAKKYDDHITYYRFNLANAGESQALQRNYCYVATIKGVKRRGADNESDAYNDSSPIFVYDVDEEWDTTGDNVITDEDGNFLIVNKTHLTFTGEMKENDYIELRVSTNPELTWTVEWDAQPGNRNELFNFSKISDSAVKCGPVAENHTNYVHYGYLHIVATNPSTGKVLRMPIYLMQLSTSYNVKTLSVNGNTGTFTQELSPYGGTISLLVVTGSKSNTWIAKDNNTFESSWPAGCSFTKEGDDKTYLNITYPANTSSDYQTGEPKTLTATITVQLVDNDVDAQGNKIVKDVVIELIQKPSDQLLDIIGMPNGVLELDCLSMDPGNFDGVVNAKGFTVVLTQPELYRFKITSTFDVYRDLTLSLDTDLSSLSDHPARSEHPRDDKNAYQYNDDEEKGLGRNYDLYDIESGKRFYINPFRMGPGDPPISGTISVTAYNIYDEKARSETRSFSVTLKSHEVYMGDIAIDANIDGKNCLLIFPDRNVGSLPRYQEGVSEPNTALNFDARDYLIVTGASSQPYQNTSFWGITQKVSGTNPYFEDSYFIDIWKKDNEYMKPESLNSLYQNTNWMVPTLKMLPFLHDKLRYSKQRIFMVGDYRHDGKEVCCWLPRYSDFYYCEFYESNWNLYSWLIPTECYPAESYENICNYLNYQNWAPEVRLTTQIPKEQISSVLDIYNYKK